MPADGLLRLALRVAAVLDDLGIPYVIGGSVASSILGEPRATTDLDVAVRVEADDAVRLVERVGTEFYVPEASARRAVREHESFNLLANDEGLKVDVFVLGDGVLDRMQLARRVLVTPPGAERGLWITSAEDQVLRKLVWYRDGGRISDRQWRDIVGLLTIQWNVIDRAYLRSTAGVLGLDELLQRAEAQAEALR